MGIGIVFRGHSNANYELIPSLFRDNGHRNNEAEMMRRVFASHPDAFKDDDTALEKLVRFQHFSLPTRIMDVTWNPLVALYFCAKAGTGEDGEVIAIACRPDKLKYFDSDTVSCLANLAYLNGPEKHALQSNAFLQVDEFNALGEAKRLVNFIKSEKSYFLNCIKPDDLAQSVLVRPKHSNRRIVAQNGAFIMFGLNESLVGPNDSTAFKIIRLVVTKEKKESILIQLDRLGFNDEAMFPELESAAKYIKDQFRTR